MSTKQARTSVAWRSVALASLALAAMLLAGCPENPLDQAVPLGDGGASDQSVPDDGADAPALGSDSGSGACCIVLVCEDLSREGCAENRGLFRGAGTTCDPGACAALLAALDTDNDGASDFEEIERGDDPNDPTDGPDIDGDGTPNGSDFDVDGDGIPNFADIDIDGDGLLNGLDPDIDGDGKSNLLDRDDDADGGPEKECDEGNPCDPGEVCCLGLCSDASNNRASCGGCGMVCPSGDACCLGTCVGGVDLTDGCGGCSDTGSCPGGCEGGRCCDDGIDCTMDMFDGRKCRHMPQDGDCDAAPPCMKVSCDAKVGCKLEVDNTNDGECNRLAMMSECGVFTCDGANGCRLTDTNVNRCAATDGACGKLVACDQATGSCVHVSDDALCADGIDCTDDDCSATFECMHDPNDGKCSESTTQCREFKCDANDGCVLSQNDVERCESTKADCGQLAEDGCDDEGNCVYVADPSLCREQVDCGVFVCDAGSFECMYQRTLSEGQCGDPGPCMKVSCGDDRECVVEEECDPAACCDDECRDLDTDDNFCGDCNTDCTQMGTVEMECEAGQCVEPQ